MCCKDHGTPPVAAHRWPAEWEPHRATWVSWPHNVKTWPGNFELIPRCFAEFVQAIAPFEPVRILAGGEAVMSDARKHVCDLANVELVDISTNDAWCRDFGPTFLASPENSIANPPLIDWEYNAWGGKYPPFDKDNAVPNQIAIRSGRERIIPGIVLEGGAVEGNGLGTIMTTESCLLHSNRNPNMSRQKMEGYFRENLSATNVLWLRRGELAGDDTDGHIDQLARFVNAKTVVAAWQEDSADINHEPLRSNFQQLLEMSDQEGNPLLVKRLPLPSPKFYDGHRLPASYCNFYFANNALFVPQFDDPADDEAIEILQGLCPDRQVIGIPSLDLVWGLGSLHCLTQQEPC